jgi:hypothetical protein
MKNGKKLTASSLLSILGVLCFATVIVAAVILSGMVNVARTASDYPIQISAEKDYTGSHAGFVDLPTTPIINNNYAFQVEVTGPVAGQAAVIHVTVSGAGLAVLEYSLDDSTYTPLNADTGGTILSASYNNVATVIYFHVNYDTAAVLTTVTLEAQSS